MLSSVAGTKPPLTADRIVCGGGVCSTLPKEDDELFLTWQECKTNEKALRQSRRAFGLRMFKTERLRAQAPEPTLWPGLPPQPG